jgi:hypothetical protein
MKKILLGLFLLIATLSGSNALSVNSPDMYITQQVGFRSTQRLCSNGGECIELYRDGTFFLNSNGTRRQGKYNYNRVNKEILLYFDDVKYPLHCSVIDTYDNGNTIVSMKFDGITYYRR